MVNHTTAIFRQIEKDNPRTHHDALEFPDGRMVLLTDLLGGQEATVLQLLAQPVTAAEIKAQERVQSWSGKSAQGDKWSFCLTAGTLCLPNQERP